MSAKRIYFENGSHRIDGVDITVDDVMVLLSNGMTAEQVEDRYPELDEADIKACIVYSLQNMQ